MSGVPSKGLLLSFTEDQIELCDAKVKDADCDCKVGAMSGLLHE
ncbi:MAG: hypothetical protein ACPGSC_07030 [Granulosicoccaceae bacterium]